MKNNKKSEKKVELKGKKITLKDLKKIKGGAGCGPRDNGVCSM
jgi:hypothetical protein